MVKERLLRFLESFWSGAVVGSVITLLWSAFRAKSAKFRYSTRVERVAVAAEDPVFGDVRVQWKGTAARNLYMATMEVENASAKDFEDVNLTIYAEENTKFLSESWSKIFVRHACQSILSCGQRSEQTSAKFCIFTGRVASCSLGMFASRGN